MDEFENLYADELEALNDIDDYSSLSPKPRRSLQFTTPKCKQIPDASSLSLDDNPLLPMPASPAITKGNSNNKLCQKRVRNQNECQADSDLEYNDEEFTESVAAPRAKRSRAGWDQPDETDLWDGCIETSPTAKHKYVNDKIVNGLKRSDVNAVIEPSSPDCRIVEKILEQRNKNLKRELKVDQEQTKNDMLLEDYDFERSRVFKRIPSTLYLPATGTDGSRAYMNIRDEASYNLQLDVIGKNLKGSNLLTVPISTLKEQLEEERRNQLLSVSQTLSEVVHRQLEEDQELIGDNTGLQQRLLWVDKYAPHQYTDLLSEESINRSLLHWLKMWDYVVFDKELPVKQNKKKEEPKKFKKKNRLEVNEELDKYKRPLQKVALLCGPPGLGKTTLAHIIAKHAGYNVVEMNASDDRSVDVFKEKIESATQMKAVFGVNPRPNCLIIDEIDGAPQAAINVLLNVVKKSDVPDDTKKKKKEDANMLRRPIICICNDQYVPALRQLRQNALLLHFPQTDSAKLAGRLYEVSKVEKFKSDMNALLVLCEKTDNDIRSCLNTLQFIYSQCKELTMKNIQSVTIGQKDSHKSLFSVWYDVMSMPRPRRNKFVNIHEESDMDIVLNTSPAARFQNILSIVHGTGEYDKLAQGLFENYLDCKFKDPYMAGVSLATEWLCFTDELSEYIQHKQNYSLMSYLPYLFVTFHFLFASNVPPKIQYPHSFGENFQKRVKCENIVSSMMSDMAPGIRTFINVPSIVQEILPPLMDIIQPTFRPVNTQLYSKKEKEDLAQLVKTMICFNLTYQQEKMPDGQYNYVLDLHVDEVVKYPGMKQHKQLSYASKQLVAREVELEKMRRSEMARAPKVECEVEKAPTGPASKRDECKTPHVPSHLQRLTAKPLGKPEETQIKDFFGRLIKKAAPEEEASKLVSESAKTNMLVTDIWFHFQGGYSNAVRRNVRVKEFL